MATAPAEPHGLAVIDRGVTGVLSIRELQTRMQTILDVMANVLEETKDYGKIPGTDKPTLFKPGAEKLCLTFQLAAGDPRIEDLSTEDENRYRIRVPIEGPDGRVLAVGIGSASSNEEKYRWRKTVCDEEWTEAPPSVRREKWFKGKNGGANWKGKQIRTSPADVDNTILKMAHKRAFIHGTLLATGASSVFNQDLEDFTKELAESIIEGEVVAGASPATPPREVRRASETSGTAPAKKASGPTTNGHGGLVTEPHKVKAVRVFGKEKNNYALLLEGDKNEYTTKDATLAVELEGFVGTDHAIRVRYKANDWNGRQYLNIESFAIADADVPASSGSVDQSEIPFGL
jgi:hypothetical protein